MTELKEFSIDDSEFLSQKKEVELCRERSVRDEEKICAKCKNVYYCDLIKEFVLTQFKLKIARLKECQASNGLNSCTNCELFFECKVRKEYVDATYEKMNEGRGGEFDF